MENKNPSIPSTPGGEEGARFNKYGFSDHGCHYGTLYIQVGIDDYDQEPCAECEQHHQPDEILAVK